MKNMRGRLVIAASLIGLFGEAQAFGSIVYDPTATMNIIKAEAVRAAQTAQDITMQINQYQTMLTNMASLRDTAFAPLGDMLRSMNSVYRQGQSLMWRAQNIDQQFGMMYPSYGTIYGMGTGGTSMNAMYRKWSDDGNESIRNAMKAGGIQVNGLDSDEAMLQRLIARSATAGGQKAAMQVGNELAAMNAQQLQKLQMLVTAQLDLQASHLARQVNRQSVNDAWTEQYRRAPVTNSAAKTYTIY